MSEGTASDGATGFVNVLGIETSCDETAAAVVTAGGVVLSDVVHSQVSIHAPYGGVVPELASRDHLRNARPVIEAALRQAGITLGEIDGIAVTCRPGLVGALLVGVGVARGLAWATGKPLVGVDHLLGHLVAVNLRHHDVDQEAPVELPFIGLLASGGHTAVYRVDGLRATEMEELGATRDDAAGEAYDKVAKALGLGYPGGPEVDRLAAEGNPDAVELARPMASRSSLEFSFSGIKTQVARWVDANGVPGDGAALRDVCAAFQRRVVQSLLDKAFRAARRESVRTLVLAGGVAANRELRARARSRGAEAGVRVVIPPVRSCTDNAAMIAYAGSLRLREGERDDLVEPSSRTLLPRRTRKGRGRR